MAKSIGSSKRLQIDKANATMVVAISIASFLTVFSMITVKSLWSQRAYQAKVISKKEKARDQLKSNIDNAKTLETSYQAFVGTSSNVLGGDPNGTGEKDGDNAKIILDALPSSYDFPALESSLDTLLSKQAVKINSISGTDQEVAQESAKPSPITAPIAEPFQFNVSGQYSTIQSLIRSLELSIRPFQVQTLTFSQSGGKDLTLNVTAQTYYQPGVTLKMGTETIK